MRSAKELGYPAQVMESRINMHQSSCIYIAEVCYYSKFAITGLQLEFDKKLEGGGSSSKRTSTRYTSLSYQPFY